MGVSGRKAPWTRCTGRPLSLPGCFLSAREQVGCVDGEGARLAEGVAGTGLARGYPPWLPGRARLCPSSCDSRGRVCLEPRSVLSREKRLSLKHVLSSTAATGQKWVLH